MEFVREIRIEDIETGCWFIASREEVIGLDNQIGDNKIIRVYTKTFKKWLKKIIRERKEKNGTHTYRK